MTKYRLIEESPEESRRAQEAWEREIREARERQDADHDAGLPALKRLFDIAHGNSGQCRKVAAFLLGLYNGQRFPFDLTDCRAVDAEIFDDMLLVLRMDSRLRAEVHTYFPNGGERFEALADDWNLHKREWETCDGGFQRRHGSYRCRIQPVQRETALLWRWSVERWNDDQEQWAEVDGGHEWGTDSAQSALQTWFDRGGENPHQDE